MSSVEVRAVTFEPGIIVARFRGQEFAQFISGAIVESLSAKPSLSIARCHAAIELTCLSENTKILIAIWPPTPNEGTQTH
jgi:hypothetical protein